MTHLEQAIRDAVEKGGYLGHGVYTKETADEFRHQILLDSLFWQALGKALGWIDADGISVAKYWKNTSPKSKYELWLWNWHALVDHLAEGKDIESFFATLIHP